MTLEAASSQLASQPASKQLAAHLRRRGREMKKRGADGHYSRDRLASTAVVAAARLLQAKNKQGWRFYLFPSDN